MTYREIVYMCLDKLKLVSDDSYYTEDHILFLVSKCRAMLLKQRYSDIKKQIPDNNFQTIYLDLEEAMSEEGSAFGGGHYLKSIQKVPALMQLATPKVYSLDYYKGEITYTNRDRMKYTGYNKYTRNIIYCSINPDEHLYFKSNADMNITKVKLTGIFQDDIAASELSKDANPEILDREVPIEDALVDTIVNMVVNGLSGASYKPKDDENNASDDLSRLANFIARNAKSGLQKQIEG